MKYKSLLMLGALVVAAPAAFASSTTDVTVTGIITPAACTPTFGGGGNFNFGQIAAQDLNRDTSTQFRSEPKQLSVTCNAPILFALRGIDGRAGSSPIDDIESFGLGYNGAEKIGHYLMRTPQASYLADGNSNIMSVRSTDGGTSWSASDRVDGTGLFGYLYSGEGLRSNAIRGIAEPIAIQRFTTDVEVWMNIVAAKDLTLTDDVLIDGAATIEVVYL